MLTWNVTYHTKPGQRTAFYEALTSLGVRDNSLQDPNALLLVETWTEPALQEAHCQTEIFAKLQVLKVKFCADVTIDKFNY